MATPPDGIPPTMQMYLFHEPGTAFPDEDPFIAGNGGDEADIVYHEYTHGLSNRLVVDAQRRTRPSATSRPARWARRGATGTRMDFLVNQGLFTDTSADGEIRGRPVRRLRATT